MKKSISVFLLSVLVATSGIADVLPLQCKVTEPKTVFSCGNGTGNAPSIEDPEAILVSGCVPPSGYSFGGWQLGDNGPVLNLATIINSQDILPLMDSYVFGNMEMTASYVPLVNLETFSSKESIVGAMYNPDVNRIYYEFPSGGMVLKPICSSASTGDGIVSIMVDGYTQELPTASSAVDLSQSGNHCWIGIEAPYHSGMKYVYVASYDDCKTDCVNDPMNLALMCVTDVSDQSLYDSVAQKIVSAMLGM